MPTQTPPNVASQDPNHQPERGNPYERHNPCRPWSLPGVDPETQHAPCDCCNPKPEPSDPCRKPPRSRGKDQDCCQQILEILRRMPGGSDIRVRKPKQSPKVKIANLCCKLPIKDAVIPMLLLFLRRWLDGTSPKNDFEKGIQAFLAGLPPKKIDDLKIGLDAYSSADSRIGPGSSSSALLPYGRARCGARRQRP